MDSAPARTTAHEGADRRGESAAALGSFSTST